MSSHRSFGSKRGKQNSQDSDDDSRFSHAPAFAALRKNATPDSVPEQGSLNFQYMKPSNSVPEASWSTFDLKSGQLKGNTNAANGNLSVSNSKAPWNWSAKGDETYITKDGECIAREVHEQFIPVSELMSERCQSKTALEHRNSDLLSNSGSNQIVSMIGGQELTLKRVSEDRFEHMDQNGNYTDGLHRGRPAKRLMEEFNRRNIEREQELKKANAIWNEWNTLTTAEQAERKAEAERNRRLTQATLDADAVEISALPRIYQAGIREIAARTRKYNSQQARSFTGHNGMPSLYTRSLQELNEEIQAYQSTRSSTAAPSVGKIDSNSDFVPIDDEDDDENLIFFNPRKDLPFRTLDKWASSKESDRINRSLENKTLLDASCHESIGTPLRSFSRVDFGGSCSDIESVASFPPRAISPSSGFCPPLIPVQGVSEPLVRSLTLDQDMKELRLACERLPRVVTLALTDKNVAYTSKAVIERLFGGAIQEIQFFPELRKAIVVFLRPHEANTFITHVTSAMAHSSHEARRLQFGATWYHRSRATAVMPASVSVLKYTLTHSATRTLLLQGLPKTITAAALLNVLKFRFADKHVVKATLISPSKNYERARDACLAAIVEFESIPQAIVARDSLEFDEVPEFLGASAQFVPDASTVAPAAKPWCRCEVCRGVSQALSEATRLRQQDAPEEYDIEADLLAPDSYAYGHEDKKRPRLTAYDEAGMRRHVRDADRGRG